MVFIVTYSPSLNGIEACRLLRTFSDAYVIMLTGRDSEIDRLIGLSVGADDYVTKPFYARELLARIQAMRRRPRASPTGETARRFGDLRPVLCPLVMKRYLGVPGAEEKDFVS